MVLGNSQRHRCAEMPSLAKWELEILTLVFLGRILIPLWKAQKPDHPKRNSYKCGNFMKAYKHIFLFVK